MWEGKKYYVEHIFLSVILVCEIWEVTILVDLQCKAVFKGLLCWQGNNPLPFQQGKGDHQNAALFPMAHQIRTALGKAGSGDVSMDHNSSCLRVHRQGTVKALHIDTLFSCLWLMLPHHPVQARPQHHECWSLYPRWETIHGINKMPGAPLPNQGHCSQIEDWHRAGHSLAASHLLLTVSCEHGPSRSQCRLSWAQWWYHFSVLQCTLHFLFLNHSSSPF